MRGDEGEEGPVCGEEGPVGGEMKGRRGLCAGG